MSAIPAEYASLTPIEPQEGPQTAFLSTDADIAIYGGGAFGGKSFALILDPLQYVKVPRFGAVIFRKHLAELTQEGGLWDEARGLYPLFGGAPRASPSHLDFRFPWGSRISFAHLDEDELEKKQGGQIAMIGFDQLEHFSAKAFFYMLHRNRSSCGVQAYMRATCNPDADSWLAGFLAWWIDQNQFMADGTTPNPHYGFAIEERSGVKRWMVKIDETVTWFDTRENAIAWQHSQGIPEKDYSEQSVTFIRARMEDNPKGLKANPDYRRKILSMDRVSRERMLNGNWKIRATAGIVFRRTDFKVLDQYVEGDVVKSLRSWDFAATEAKRATNAKRMSDKLTNDPDWTVGVRGVLMKNKDIIITDMFRDRISAGRVEQEVMKAAAGDGKRTRIRIPQDPGQAGKAQVEHYVKHILPGYIVQSWPVTGSKLARAESYAAYVEHGHVYLLAAPWNAQFLSEHEAFPTPSVHDDIVDAAADLYNGLIDKPALIISDNALGKV
jgi:predicted phage terminase large subunit-like protein